MANDFIFRLKHITKQSYYVHTLLGLYHFISVDHLLPTSICYYLTKYTRKWSLMLVLQQGKGNRKRNRHVVKLSICPVPGCAEPPDCAPGEKPVTG